MDLARRLDRLFVPSSDRADEAKALARDGADQFLVFTAVADCAARGVDAAGQRRFRHDPSAPDRADQVVLADDAIAVLHQEYQEIEHLGLDGYRLRTAKKLAAVGIERMIVKEKLHGTLKSGPRPALKQ